MKKLLLSIAMVAAGAAAYAQKPASGDITLETQLNFQVGNAPISIFTPNVRARYFINPGLAGRLQFLLATSSTTLEFAENNDGTGATGEVKRKSSSFTFRPGIEKHFTGTSKLSPYVGAELDLTFRSASEEWTNSDGEDYVKDQKRKLEGTNSDITDPDDNAGSRIGINLIFGTDYYFTESIYVGGEFTWGWGINTFKDITDTQTVPPSAESKSVTLGGSSSGFGILTSAVRLGVKF